jgi:hypothetical protein
VQVPKLIQFESDHICTYQQLMGAIEEMEPDCQQKASDSMSKATPYTELCSCFLQVPKDVAASLDCYASEVSKKSWSDDGYLDAF